MNKNLIIVGGIITIATAGILIFSQLPTKEQSDINSVISEQDSYFQAHGKYSSKLVTPAGMQVIDYDGPRGKGYQVIVRSIEGNVQVEKTIGYGPDAADYTHEYRTPINTHDGINVASTTQ